MTASPAQQAAERIERNALPPRVAPPVTPALLTAPIHRSCPRAVGSAGTSERAGESSDEDALRFTRANAWRAIGRLPETRLVDWRAFPADVGRFDRVIASDVLYEPPYVPLIATATNQRLAASGTAVITDHGRIAAPAFLANLPAHGLVLSAAEVRPYDAGAVHQRISVYMVRRGGAARTPARGVADA